MAVIHWTGTSSMDITSMPSMPVGLPGVQSSGESTMLSRFRVSKGVRLVGLGILLGGLASLAGLAVGYALTG